MSQKWKFVHENLKYKCVHENTVIYFLAEFHYLEWMSVENSVIVDINLGNNILSYLFYKPSFIVFCGRFCFRRKENHPFKRITIL